MIKRLLSLLLVMITVLSMFCNYSINVSAMKSHEGILPFEDVKTNYWYYDSVLLCYINGIVTGYGNEYTFAPDSDMTRATFVVMLARVLNADLEGYTETSFLDCPEGTWYTASVEWAAEQGYVNGTGNGKFSPDTKVSREQAATMFARIIDKQGFQVDITEGPAKKFNDYTEISDWALYGTDVCVAAEIFMGGYKNNFLPKDNMTRAAAAATFIRFINNIYYADCEHIFSERTCTEPAKCSICGYANEMPLGHDCSVLSCTKGSKCATCGEYVENDPTRHNYKVATCTTAAYCRNCGYVKGKPNGHKFVDATCYKAKTCRVCGFVEGEKLGHDIVEHICTRCGYEYFKNEQQRVIYYIKRKGEWVDGLSVYESGIHTGSAFDKRMTSLVYDNSNNTLYAVCEVLINENYSLFFIDITKTNYGMYTFVHEYQNTKTGEHVISSGVLDPATGEIWHLNYEIEPWDETWYKEITKIAYKQTLDGVDYQLLVLCDSDIKKFGFVE